MGVVVLYFLAFCSLEDHRLVAMAVPTRVNWGEPLGLEDLPASLLPRCDDVITGDLAAVGLRVCVCACVCTCVRVLIRFGNNSIDI